MTSTKEVIKKKYIVINGSDAWLMERRDKDSAIQSATSVCDHSKEIIVREVEEFTDYTRIFINKE